jgi:hypothetical protein
MAKQIAFGIVVLMVLIIFGGWTLIYPSPTDPKNIRYVLWKAGLYKLDLNVATAAMIGDRDRDRLVVGKTEAALREKFGLLLNPKDASPYLSDCYQRSPWTGKPALFIGKTPWVILLEGGKAKTLILLKGC